jgi:hypothetical protein
MLRPGGILLDLACSITLTAPLAFTVFAQAGSQSTVEMQNANINGVGAFSSTGIRYTVHNGSLVLNGVVPPGDQTVPPTGSGTVW